MSRFEVMNHALVPEHKLLSPEEVEAVIGKYSISIDELPKMKRSDACIRSLELRVGEIPRGSIVKIIRRSDTAGISYAYRLVVD
jgi:DNA-directed RNA polymerase subunit H